VNIAHELAKVKEIHSVTNFYQFAQMLQEMWSLSRCFRTYPIP